MTPAARPARGRWAARGAWAGLVLLAAVSAPARAAEIALTSAWMRPALAGSDARAYVDIRSDVPLTLVGASSPQARRVEIRVVKDTDGVDPGKPVRRLPVSAGVPVRLAYKGNHLLLVGLRSDAANGAPVPVTLRFTDARGRQRDARVDIEVRGLLPPRPGA